MRNWYVCDEKMVFLDDVTCVLKFDDYVRVRHGVSDCWDAIYGKGKNKQQKAESVEKIFAEIKKIVTAPLDK